MSFQAVEWARSLPLDTLSAKFTLMMIGSYADTDGTCFPSISRLAEDTLQSEATVRRRIREFEQIGLAVCFQRWETPDRKVVVVTGADDDRPAGARRSSNEIRLALHVRPAELASMLTVWKSKFSAEDGREEPAPPMSNCEGGEGVTAVQGPPCHLGDTAPLAQPCKDLNRESKLHLSTPPNPPPGGGSPADLRSQGSEGEVLPDHAWPGSDTWFEFEKAWQEPIVNHSKTRGIWSALTEDERKTAINAARGYVAWRKAQRRPPAVMNAHRFLNDRGSWPSFCQQAAKAEQVAQQTRVAVDSPEGRAWRNICKLGGAASPWESGGSYLLPRCLTAQELAFETLPDRDWTFLESGVDVQKIGAWSEFFASVLRGVNRRPLCDHHGVGNKRRHGCEMPWPWPPKKDGSLSTAPPQGAITESDADALAQN